MTCNVHAGIFLQVNCLFAKTWTGWSVRVSSHCKTSFGQETNVRSGREAEEGSRGNEARGIDSVKLLINRHLMGGPIFLGGKTKHKILT